MHGACREVSGKAICAIIGGQVHCPSARKEFVRERFRREKMSPGASGGEEYGFRRQGYSAGTSSRTGNPWPRLRSVSGRLRLSANTIPMEMAIAISDEPP